MENLRNKYIEAIATADDEDALEAVRLTALGKKGEVSLKMRELGQMSPEERQFEKKVKNFRKELPEILVSPFNYDTWSQI